MAIGCSDVDQKAEFFGTCCHPRLSSKQSDDSYPAACQLSSYLVFEPEYKDNKVVAKLGSLRDYQKKIGYEDKDVESESSSSSDKKQSTSSSQAPSSTWTPESSSKKSSSSSSHWALPSSSWTPEPAPSSSSSQWVAPSSSSSQWTPEASPSSSSQQVWSESSKKEEAVWTPSSSSSYQAPAPSTSSSSSNNGGDSSGDFSGQASWFTQNGNPGACGIYHSDSDHIVALQVDMVSERSPEKVSVPGQG